MKKITFPAITNICKYQLEWVDGYTDGTYNYYKRGTTWYSILPEYGLAVCLGSSRKQVAENSHDPGMIEKIKSTIHGEDAKRFTKYLDMIDKAWQEQARKEAIERMEVFGW